MIVPVLEIDHRVRMVVDVIVHPGIPAVGIDGLKAVLRIPDVHHRIRQLIFPHHLSGLLINQHAPVGIGEQDSLPGSGAVVIWDFFHGVDTGGFGIGNLPAAPQQFAAFRLVGFQILCHRSDVLKGGFSLVCCKGISAAAHDIEPVTQKADCLNGASILQKR